MINFRPIMKSVLMIIAAALFCLSVFAVNNNAFADDNGGDCGDGVRWDVSNNTITISYTGSGTGAMTDYTDGYDTPWHSQSLRTIIIGEGVTHIGKNAFSDIKGVKRLIISDTVKTIGNGAFYTCWDINSVTMGKNVETIGDEAFLNCSGFKTLILPSTLTKVGKRTFYQCFDLSTLTFMVPSQDKLHDLEIGSEGFGENHLNAKIVYSSEKGILSYKASGAKVAEGSLIDKALSGQSLTWGKNTPTNYVITFDPNDGGMLKAGITTQRIPVNTSAPLLTKATLDLQNVDSDLNFLGWAKKKDAKTAEYGDGANYRATDDVTLYAVWESKCTITFNANGGSFTASDPTMKNVKAGQSVNLTKAADLGLKNSDSNLYFTGWAENQNADKADYEDGASFTPTGDVTLYAIWKAKCVITLDPNGGTFSTSEGTTLSVVPGTNEVLPTAQELGLKNADSALYFIGWSTDKSAASESYIDGGTCTPQGDMTLYALWIKNGDGTQTSPFLIDNFERLKQLATDVSNGKNYRNKHFRLTAEIGNTDENFTPIGKNYSRPFSGTFNGGGHKITYKISNSSNANDGLFGYLDSGGTIRNLKVAGSIDGGGKYCGGIVGWVGTKCSVINCYSTVGVLASNNTTYIGGIAGHNTGLIDHCVSNGILKNQGIAKTGVGGITGGNQRGTVSYCSGLSMLGSTNAYIGMVVADNRESYGAGTITACNYYLPFAGKSNSNSDSSDSNDKYKGVGDKDGGKDLNTTPLTAEELKAYVNKLDDEYAVLKRGIIEGSSLGLGGDDDDDDDDNNNGDDIAASDKGASGGCNAGFGFGLYGLAIALFALKNKKIVSI